MKQNFSKRTHLNASVQQVFEWHKQPDAIQLLTPPSKKIQVISRKGTLGKDGFELSFRMYLFSPFFITWVARHDHYIENQQFRDVQVKGPFHLWEHTHRFVADGEDACWMEDDVVYQLPFDLLGHWVMGAFIRYDIESMFEHRHQVLTSLFNTEEGMDT